MKAIAVDAADNISAVTTASFTQAPPAVVTPPAPTQPGTGTTQPGTGTTQPGTGTTPPGTGTTGPVTGPAALIPLAPSIGQARPGKPGGAKTATATWRVPRANGAILNGYQVRAIKIRPGKDKVSSPVRVGPTTAKLKMRLSAGSYRFQVRATSAAGGSPWSQSSNKVRAR